MAARRCAEVSVMTSASVSLADVIVAPPMFAPFAMPEPSRMKIFVRSTAVETTFTVSSNVMVSTPVGSKRTGAVVECMTGFVVSAVSVIATVSAATGWSDVSFMAPATRRTRGSAMPMAAWRWASVRTMVTATLLPDEDTVAPLSLVPPLEPAPSRM